MILSCVVQNLFLEDRYDMLIEKYITFCFSLVETVIGKVPAIKPQIALFEQLGPEGMILLSSLCKYANSKDFLVIMDAKRGDIGSTSKAYADTFLGKNRNHSRLVKSKHFLKLQDKFLFFLACFQIARE